MKAIKRILSICVVLSMLLSLASVSAFADALQHTVSLSVVGGETTVKAGDTIDVSLSLDTSNTVMAVDYNLAVPTDAFEFDYEADEYFYDEYGIYAPGCTVEEWAEYIVDFGKTASLGEIAIGANAVVNGKRLISFHSARSGGISESKAEEDMEIGRYTIKVAENAAPGEYQIYLYHDDTTDYISTISDGEGATTTIISEPITITVEGNEPAAPTAKDYGLFTDAKQNFKVTTPVMTSNGYAIEKALGFVSGINKDVKLECGTEITCQDSDKVLYIPAKNFYEATDLVNGFVAAVTSIRDTNLDKEFSARAYVIVDGVKVYAEEIAKAVYGK